MATTYKNTGSKFWFARFTDRHGKRVSRSTKSESRREAKRIAAEMEAVERKAPKESPDISRMIFRTIEIASLELQQGTLTVAKAEDLIRRMVRDANPEAVDGSFRRFAAAWLDAKERDTKDCTSASYRNAVKFACLSFGAKADQPLYKLTISDLEGFQTYLVDAGLRGKTINHHLSVVRRILESAVQKDLIAKNPARPIKGRPRTDSRRRSHFTIPEWRRLVERGENEEWRGLIILAAQTGLRCGDLLQLTAENVVGTAIRFQPSKTADSSGKILTVPLSPPCLSWLEGRKGPLFPSIKVMKGTTVSQTFTRIMKSAQVAKTVVEVAGENPVTSIRSFHSLRHSFASWLAEADVHADVRMKLTGHSSSTIHAGYTHHDEALAKAVQTLPAL